MIGGYVERSCSKDALELFNRMCKQGMQPSAVTYFSILKACACPSGLKWDKEVYACGYHKYGSAVRSLRIEFRVFGCGNSIEINGDLTLT
jgi:pentatricopeptide repeat protein